MNKVPTMDERAREMDLLVNVFNKFGYQRQANKLVEECGELVQAVAKLVDAKLSGEVDEAYLMEVTKNFVEEMEDVGILIDQFRIAGGVLAHKEVRKAKLARIVERYPDVSPSQIVKPNMRIVKG